MDLTEAKNKAVELMESHGLIEQGWRFEFDTAVRRFGCCDYNGKTISLSSSLVSINEWEQVSKTVLHEIAHALVGRGHGHDNVWRRKAVEVGDDGGRLYGNDVVRVQEKWAWHCSNPECICGGTRFRKRKGIICGRCKSKLVWIKIRKIN